MATAFLPSFGTEIHFEIVVARGKIDKIRLYVLYDSHK